MNRNLKPTRAHTADEQRIAATVSLTLDRIAQLQRELSHHKSFLNNAQNDICPHDFRGQDDEHPHGTPMETFICTICRKEERR